MQIFFHVGLPRAASTFLQYKVFPVLEGIKYIKKHNFKKRDKIILKSGFDKFLLSSEMDIGKKDCYERLKQIANEYPDAKTILVLRKHSSWIKSKYFYYIRKQGSSDFNEFFNFENTGFFLVEHLECKRKIAIIEKYFKHKPFIIFQEDISKNPVDVIKKLVHFMNVQIDFNKINFKKVNKSFTLYELRSLLYLNKKLKNWPENVKAANFFYKSFRNLLIRLSVLYSKVSTLWSPYPELIIQSELLLKIDAYFKEDWNYCIKYAEENNGTI